MAIATSNQTIGPYWGLIDYPEWADLLRFGATGDRITLTGRVTDGDDLPVSDGAVEIWQADPPVSKEFPAFGRCATDIDGMFRFETLKPGPVPGLGNTQQAPHVAITIHARGLLVPLTTRLYFSGEALNDDDPVLGLIDDAQRRDTLIAKAAGDGVWRLDIKLQGVGETVFLEV